jgi:hypothetical protein
VGFNTDVFDVRENEIGEFMIRTLIYHREKNFIWNFVNVYGAAQKENKCRFLSELSSFCSRSRAPLLVGGDFNIIRKADEKNKPGGVNKWSFLFNSIIEQNGLIEFDLSNRLFTWSNNRIDPTFEKLDRFLASPEWDLAYNNTNVRALNRSFSDHVPLCIQTDVISTGSRIFKYELCWKDRPDFHKKVIQNWSIPVKAICSIDIWKTKIKRLKQMLKGWNINVEGHYKKMKKELLAKIDTFDNISEVIGLSENERMEKLELELTLKKIVDEERAKLKQRARDKFILEGDENSKYFHLLANYKRRKLKIVSLSHDDIVAQDDNAINQLATSFYQNLFGPSQETDISLNDLNMQLLDDFDRSCLTRHFDMDEIREVVFSMKHNRAPGPDSIPVEFFQEFWDTIKTDLFKLFQDFYAGTLNIERLNYGVVTLIPKVPNVDDIKAFRPICLLNVCYKIITKVLTNRLANCITNVISDCQYGFIKGKYIMDGVVSLHEIIHEVKKKKQSGVIFKVDFEKAYDKVNWNFLYQMMIKKGFGDKWCDWVMKTVRGGKVAIKTNDKIGPYFTTHKGVRQGDPFSPLLFNIAADGLACLIQKAKDEGIIKGLIPHIIPNGCCCLQYADDTIFLLQDDLLDARNLKFILCLFEQMSGLKINFHKSEIFCLGEASVKENWYADIFTCPYKCLPMKYLGVPIDDKKLCKSLWLPTVEKVEKKWALGKENSLA